MMSPRTSPGNRISVQAGAAVVVAATPEGSDSESRSVSAEESISGEQAEAAAPSSSSHAGWLAPASSRGMGGAGNESRSASDNEGPESTEEEEEEDWEAAEVARFDRQLSELINWLGLELAKRRVNTARQLSDALREQAKPFLDKFGRRQDLPQAGALVMKLHEILKRYDIEIEGAEERLGLEPFLKGRGSYAETMGPNTRRREVYSDSESDSASESYNSSGSEGNQDYGYSGLGYNDI